ncbi:uncharacterized protein LOC122537452 isoform X2 [Frieseomelitta varia]|uniref:uncharacterized protein LOC122537452 isoform X2 n=1 Tax=Frieseomelitta varia TaxID=561572 RepID=UPI001CB68526|nr:uncharacterized protein LOC122537452 isoform X2 [Frieseomelitta varia]
MTGTVFLTFTLACLSPCLAQMLEDKDDLTGRNGSKLLASCSRRPRALVFPDPSQFLLIFGLGTPLQLERESVIIGMFTKIIYAMPSNATDYTIPGVYYSRTQKSRWSIYKTLEKVAGIYGFGGKACLLKAICEAASAPFDGRYGLLGQLLHVFFKQAPRSTSKRSDSSRRVGCLVGQFNARLSSNDA